MKLCNECETHKPITFNEAAERVVQELVELLCAKQRDYGTNNILKFGELGVIVRASDKVERLINLHKSEDGPKFETIDDTYKDMANYGIIGLMLRRGWFTLPLG